MKKKSILYLVIPLVILTVLYFALGTVTKDVENKDYSEIVSMINNGEIKEFSLNLSTGKFVYKTTDDKEASTTIANPNFFHDDVGEKVIELGIKAKYEKSGITAGTVVSIATLAITTAFMWRIMKQFTSRVGGKGDFGKKKLNVQMKTGVKFADVAGADEEKADLQEIVEFLKDPGKYSSAGARIPKGVLLVGPPGTGKTLLARAVAGEAGVPFYSVSGSDFVEMFVGVGALRVRELFGEAKKHTPAIVFIDEIDAVARQRGTGVGGGNDEREQTLNQILVEMDGFDKQNVVVMAATNRPDVLDKAILRPGRFDRQVVVNLPDVKGREEILRIHGQNKKFEDGLSPKIIAEQTVGFSGADLENLLNEAALLMVRRDKKEITQKEIDDAYLKVVMGNEKPTHITNKRDKEITAYHEAGHAIVSHMLGTSNEVQQISIIPRGMAAGFTMYKPKADKGHTTKKDILNEICSYLGGRAAEEIMFGNDNITTGASNDIERATQEAVKLVTKYGMGSMGPLLCKSYSDKNNLYGISDVTKQNIDAEVSKLVKTQYYTAREILESKKDKLTEVSNVLLDREKISGEEFREIMSL